MIWPQAGVYSVVNELPFQCNWRTTEHSINAFDSMFFVIGSRMFLGNMRMQFAEIYAATFLLVGQPGKASSTVITVPDESAL